ncbi:lipopolysaccharide-binding protein [Parambassis ranga]|uniref:Bactericidal permeability-increasing protein n=1 Tax=Parambassis ranga TaxID=210632 RepID=A0A6P7ICE7_9TELE|nr:lipopolysaccharide-binding protein-like [Parambassis ranga]
MLLSVIIVLTLLSYTCGDNPAIQMILTNKGLQYGKQTSVGWIQGKLGSLTVPDIHGGVDIGIGTVYYTLTGITVTKCDFPEPSVEFAPEVTGFRTSISGINLALTGQWFNQFGIIHDSGSFQAAIISVDVTSVLELGRDPDGHLSVDSASCDAHVGNVDVEFYGGASFIFQPFVDHFRGRIRAEIEMKICPAVKESILNLEYHLQAMNVSFDINQVLTLALPLTDSPLMDASSLKLCLKGEFYSINNPVEPPFEAQRFTMTEQSAYMLSVGLSEYSLNTASYGYYSAGFLQVLINDSMIPHISPVRLNTSYMGQFIPQLPKMFPGLLMTLQVYATEAPMFSLHPDAVKLCSQVAVKAFAIQPNGTQTPLFKLSVDSKFSGKMWIASGRLKGSMTMDNLTLTLASSEVGMFETDALQNMARTGMKFVVLTKLNDKLGKGII